MALLDDLLLELPAGYEFTPVELRQIELAQSQLDDVATLEAVLATQEALVNGHAGQPRVNTLFAELRQSRHEAARQIEIIRRGMLQPTSPIKSGTRYSHGGARVR